MRGPCLFHLPLHLFDLPAEWLAFTSLLIILWGFYSHNVDLLASTRAVRWLWELVIRSSDPSRSLPTWLGSVVRRWSSGLGQCSRWLIGTWALHVLVLSWLERGSISLARMAHPAWQIKPGTLTGTCPVSFRSPSTASSRPIGPCRSTHSRRRAAPSKGLMSAGFSWALWQASAISFPWQPAQIASFTRGSASLQLSTTCYRCR